MWSELGLLPPSVLWFFFLCFVFILVEQSSAAFLEAKYQAAEKTVAVETERRKVITVRIKHTLGAPKALFLFRFD